MICNFFTGGIAGVLFVVGLFTLIGGLTWFGLLCLAAAYAFHKM